MKRIGLLLTLLCMLVFSVTVSAAEISSDGYVEVMGVGEPGQSYNAGIRAAEVMAYRKAAEEIGEMQLDSDTTVEQGLTQSDTVRTKLHAVIRRAKVVKEYRGEDGYFYATVRVPIFGIENSVASVVMPRHEKTEPFPQPRQEVAASGGYTGVIVDCRGLGLVTAMSPVIKDEKGEKIYGYKNLDCDYVIKHGMASYNSEGRAGSNPLRIKAVSVEGYGKPCNPVISAQDANRLLAENAKAHFLERCAVVFLR